MNLTRISFFLWMILIINLPSFLFAQNTLDSISIFVDSNLVLDNPVPDIKVDTFLNKPQENIISDYLLRKDSLDAYYYSFFTDSTYYRILNYVDTSNHTSGNYNPVRNLDVSYSDLGIIGSAQHNQIFNPSVETGFSVGINSFNAFLWKPKDIKLYDVRTPYTDLFYLMGSKKENAIKVTHAQSFLKQQLTASFEFQLFNHLGYYNYQKTDVKSFFGGLGYRTANSRYQANAQYYHNKIVLEENGGITNLAEFEDNTEKNRQIVETNLSTAENLIRISGIAFEQSFYVSKPEPDFSQIPDTNIIQYDAYSVTHFKKPYFDPVTHLGQFKHYFNFERGNYRYTDSEQKSKIYDSIPFYLTYDSTKFFDTIGVRKYENEIIYCNADYKDDLENPKFLSFFGGAKHEYNEYYQDSTKNFYQHFAAIGGVFINVSKNISLVSDGAYYVGDFMSHDFLVNGKIFVKFKKQVISGGIQYSHRSPDKIFQEFSSSRFTWINGFDKVDQQKLFLNYQRKNLSFSIQVRNISNYIYFNEQIVPEQASGSIQHILVQAYKDFRIRNWGTDLRITYQNVSNSNVIRVPELIGKAKLFYHNLLFNNALDLEIGLEFYYFTKYYADKYMPAIRSFHLQNEQEIGEYLVADAYVNAKIGKARLFVRYDHFNYSFMGYNYYSSPDYPAQDGSFRFGVHWLLFN